MSKRDLVNRAIRECLQRCYASNNILATIEDYMGELRSTSRLAEGDVRAVERGVREVLYAILKDAPDRREKNE